MEKYPGGPDGRERELHAVYDALEAQSTKLPPIPWRTVTIVRAGDPYDVRVTV